MNEVSEKIVKIINDIKNEDLKKDTANDVIDSCKKIIAEIENAKLSEYYKSSLLSKVAFNENKVLKKLTNNLSIIEHLCETRHHDIIKKTDIAFGDFSILFSNDSDKIMIYNDNFNQEVDVDNIKDITKAYKKINFKNISLDLFEDFIQELYEIFDST
jgi:hypothetical protein